ncbi:MAG: hypothetical protein K2G19_00610, partial [Lachnospiraceae bacterium]|nr:hypothetical protein [Lachnospiraceae bacterium]
MEFENSTSPSKCPDKMLAAKQTGFYLPIKVLGWAGAELKIGGEEQMIDLKANPFYLDEEGIAWVKETLAGMTVEEKAGQLFCVLFKEAKEEEFDYVYNILS